MSKKQWLVEKHKDGTYSVLEPNTEAGMSGVCYAGKYFGVVTSDSKEDAYLIAAAPDMYEALKDADNELCRICGQDCEPYKCAAHMKRMDALLKAEAGQ